MQPVPAFTAKIDIIGQIMAFEDGQLDEADTLALFQSLINTGLAWQLQGSYGSAAQRLINCGLCVAA